MSKRKATAVGNYKFTGKTLGKGNFARVEEAFHEVLGTKVAVKVMDLNNIKEDYVIKNLYREAKIMSKLKHPCIATLFETIQRQDYVYYLVTEIVNGGDLCTYVKSQRSGKLEEKITKPFAQQFASALGYMHQRGVVHRDLKMENVMLNAMQNQIKIVDFGLSNEWYPDNPLRTHCGSPEYAAPELFVTSKVYGPEVDLWSLGIILYGMVVGQLPFISNKAANLTSQERRKILVSQINKGISINQRRALSGFSFEFRNVINRLLSADAKKRISIKELILHPWITDGGKKIVRISPTKKVSNSLHNKILQEISDITKITMVDLTKKIKDKPLGRLSGMYNILVFKYTVRPYVAELIARPISDSPSCHLPLRKESSPSARLVHTARTESKRFRISAARPRTESEDLRKPKPTKSSRDALAQLPTRMRPQSVGSSPFGDVRPATSALSKRKEYSANLASRIWRKTPSPRSVDGFSSAIKQAPPKTPCFDNSLVRWNSSQKNVKSQQAIRLTPAFSTGGTDKGMPTVMQVKLASGMPFIKGKTMSYNRNNTFLSKIESRTNSGRKTIERSITSRTDKDALPKQRTSTPVKRPTSCSPQLETSAVRRIPNCVVPANRLVITMPHDRKTTSNDRTIAIQLCSKHLAPLYPVLGSAIKTRLQRTVFTLPKRELTFVVEKDVGRDNESKENKNEHLNRDKGSVSTVSKLQHTKIAKNIAAFIENNLDMNQIKSKT